MMKTLPSVEFIRSRIDYDHRTGLIRRKSSGKVIGFHSHNGYLKITFGMNSYFAHRIIWKLMTGSDPIDQIDHINRIRDDNRWKNLREATGSQNQWNRLAVGSHYRKDANRTHPYRATIRIYGKIIYLGDFTTERQARMAYLSAARRMRGEFARDANVSR